MKPLLSTTLYILPVAALVLMAMPIGAISQEIECQDYPQQTSSSWLGSLETTLSSFLTRITGGVTAQVESDLNNLYESYPDADRLVLGQSYLSTVCRFLNEDEDISTEQKITIYNTALERVTAMTIFSRRECNIGIIAGAMEGNATIDNVTISGAQISTDNPNCNIGAVAGTISGNPELSNITIRNVEVLLNQ